uniref:Retroviral polymerase SH3-like domain-containing protein n=1 Tax=Tanacetum cinerariifolium TaxID=118510 RepID=A0A699GPL5_TANCI|nr:hypothetical protein [Tanacetum cinerariifolium]
MTTTVVNNLVFRGFFEKQKLTGPNFIDWYRQLRIVLPVADKLDYLEQPIPPAPVLAQASQQVALEALAAHTTWELLHTVKDFHSCKQEEEQSVSSYVLKLKSYIDNLERLGHPVSLNLRERRNRTLLDMVCSMMSQITLPKSFWDYAVENAARILNMVLTKKVKKTPYNVWHGQAPKLSYLKVWGCEALVKRDTLTKPDKLEPRSIKCIFVRYPKETMDYSFYYPPENKVLVARNAKFLKNSLITQEASESLEDLEIILEEDTHPSMDTTLNYEYDVLEIDEPQSDIIPIRRSTRTRNAPNRMCLYIDTAEHELGDLGEPANYKAALLDPNSDKWLNVMNVEMQSMKDNEVLDLVDLPPNGKTVDIRAIRILIAIAAYYDYEIWQMDFKTAFLNGHLSEERFHIKNSKRGIIPMQEKLRLSKSQGVSTPAELKRMQNVPYASVVGSIINTKDVFLVYEGDIKRELRVSCYTNAGYLTDADDLKSQTGYVFVLNRGVVDGKSTKQSIFTTSYAEAEYIVAYDASKEAVWVRKFIYGLGVVPTIEEPKNMYCDHTEAITIANES